MHIVSSLDSFVISFFTPHYVFVFRFLLKFSWLKQLFHHVIPLLQNPSWQSFTICFSNSFPASSAQTLLFSLAGFLPPGQTSWPFPTSLLLSPVPPGSRPLSLCLQVVAAQDPWPWQHCNPTGSDSSPGSVASMVFSTQQLYYFVTFILLFYFVSFLQATILSPVSLDPLLCCSYSSHSLHMAVEHLKMRFIQLRHSIGAKYTGLQRVCTEEWILYWLNGGGLKWMKRSSWSVSFHLKLFLSVSPLFRGWWGAEGLQIYILTS